MVIDQTFRKTLQTRWFLAGVILFAGCSDKIPFGGTVTYSDDGSPLSMGTVYFEKDGFQARGVIDSGGHYALGTLKLKDGIPKGTYRVFLSGIVQTERIPMAPVGSSHSVKPAMPRPLQPGQTLLGDILQTQLVDRKFTDPKTSELTVVVDGKTRIFDFQVDRFKR